MRYAPFMKENDTIGFVAPSFGATLESYRIAFDYALRNLEARGCKTWVGPNCFKDDGIGISTNPKDCAEEWMDAYENNRIQTLVSCGGGELMCEDLDYIDFAHIRAVNPKWFMGYSDNTNLTFLLTTLCDTASIYGPNAKAFGMEEPWHQSVEDAYALLHGRKLSFDGYDIWRYEDAEGNVYGRERKIHSFVPEQGELVEKENAKVQMRGRLLGGCMDCLVNLVGTSYDKVTEFVENYKEDGIIWFLESCDLNVFGIRRAIWQLEHAGWFQYTKGFLIGRPMHFEEPMMKLDQYHAVTDILSKYQKPVLMDLDIGHLAPTIPIVCGSVGEVVLNGQIFQLNMELI